IAKITGTSRRTVSERIQQLEELKLISRESQKGQSIYRLLECGRVKKNHPEAQLSLFEGEKSGR
ncbi:MAG: hypothetical protein M1461_12265, partial [Nitrospirae bacterium]|nr:hypothetical protein [Nitrospirota bacterium]